MGYRRNPFYTGDSRKYHNSTITVPDGKFDSYKELNRWHVLSVMLKAGEITDLRRQVKYILIPDQHGPDIIGPRGGVKKGPLLEKGCSYIADFVYKKDGELIVEDTKGFRTKEYIIKRKLMLFVHGIRIKEI